MKSVNLEQTVTKIGNSHGVIIPAKTMKELGITTEDLVELVITVKRKPPEYNIKELMANTDFVAQSESDSLTTWHRDTAVGKEIV
jgi:antitoxin component of MazEF toxin-antitoxin module